MFNSLVSLTQVAICFILIFSVYLLFVPDFLCCSLFSFIMYALHSSSKTCTGELLNNDECNKECNIADCDFDNGICAEKSLDQLNQARVEALMDGIKRAGNDNELPKNVVLISKFATIFEGSLFSMDDEVQAGVLDSAKTTHSRLDGGLDVFGHASNYVDPLVWQQYKSYLDTMLVTLQDLEAKATTFSSQQNDRKEFNVLKKQLALMQLAQKLADTKMIAVIKTNGDKMDNLDSIIGDLSEQNKMQFVKLTQQMDR